MSDTDTPIGAATAPRPDALIRYLTDSSAALARAETEAQHWRDLRDELMAEAAEIGFTRAHIGRAVGLTGERVTSRLTARAKRSK